jgi:hypothetical protein
MSEVVALYSTRSEAERATDELLARGYDAERIGYLDRYRDESGDVVTDENYFADDDSPSNVIDEATKGAAGGAVGGAAVGAGAGLLASAGLLLVPGFGPFLAAGTLAATLGGAGIGATSGGMVGGVTGAILGVVEDGDDETSRFYREGVAQGQALVSVDVEEADAMEVASLLRATGAERVDVYGDEGWFE